MVNNFNPCRSLLVVSALFLMISFPVSADVVYQYDFEYGWNGWWANNGVWDVGTPTAGPPECHSPTDCAATNLSGNYPDGSNTSLISPHIALPTISGDEKIRLQFWHWFNLSDDQGYVEIKEVGGEWQTLHGPFDGTSSAWTQVYVDLSDYAGLTVDVAFRFTSGSFSTALGWYVDDVAIRHDPVEYPNPEDFELGVGDWSADNGLWQVGTPTVGPSAGHSGTDCAGTVLGGNYSDGANTRLVSPETTLPADRSSNSKILLLFWQWFSLSDDAGYVQISVDGGSWQTVHGTVDGDSLEWTQVVVDLTAYAGSTIRLSFYFSSGSFSTDSGWYIDDVSLFFGPVVYPNPENFESGPGFWSATNGLWQIGEPTVGPEDCPSPVNCAGTVLDGNYYSGANSCLLSLEFTLTDEVGQYPGLYFKHWFRLGDDQGQVYVVTEAGDWIAVGEPFDGNGGEWSQVYVDLFAYKGMTIRIAFCITSGSFSNDNGWYLDDIWMEGIEEGTVTAALTCVPNSGTVPFATQLSVSMTNNSDETRSIAGLLTVDLASGQFVNNWRRGYTNLTGGQVFQSSWTMTIPAQSFMIGDNVFSLYAQDVTPEPYNQPPYQPSGDTGFDSCTIEGIMP